MQYKKKLILVILLAIIIGCCLYILPYSHRSVAFYSQYVFAPFQYIRNAVFSILPFSLGDILYIALGIALIYAVVKIIYCFLQIKKRRSALIDIVLNSLMGLEILFFIFFIGWGGNYYKEPLSEAWKIKHTEEPTDSLLVRFDKLLVARMNTYAPLYRPALFGVMTAEAIAYYNRYAVSNSSKGLHVKPSLFGNMMQYMGVQGYYNPFTGEAQVNANLPKFMLPFVIMHEMAHQYGVGAEDDANLLAYVLSMKSNDNGLRYSASFNIWLYTHSMLRQRDTVAANEIKAMLNPITLGHIDTLRALRRKYRGDFSKYSGRAYDSYLKLNNQKDGIESYDKVAISAYLWETGDKKDSPVFVP